MDEHDFPLAGLGARFVGRLVDHVAACLVSALLLALALPLTHGLGLSDARGRLVSLVVGLAGFLAVVVVNAYLISQSGQSMGKRLVGTRVVTVEGMPLPLRLSLLREGVPVLLCAIPVVGGLYTLVDAVAVLRAGHRRLTDRLVDTCVVRADATEGVYALFDGM